MRRWPPLVWLCIALGSLLVAVGVGGAWNPEGFVPGALLLLVGFGLSLYLAYGRREDRPHAGGVAWLLPLTALFFLLAGAAGMLSGGKYALAALGAAIIPLTAVALIVATTRSKTAGADDARRETAADAEDDPFPGMGMDDHTPLGDTSQHSDAERVATPERGFRAR